MAKSKKKIRKEDALEYHSSYPAGKLEVIPTKATDTQRDLSLAYSPGVAEPCLAIADHKNDVYKYTAKGNLVAVISNGTAVLGLGDIGPEASKPVMEGKGLLFKIFAGIDVFDIEVDVTDVDEFVKVVKALEPTFGGVNLEDIKAPECFEIEQRLKKEMNIPVMHDDQHGTAIISAAGLLNAAEVVGKTLSDMRIVVSGAGASALSCIQLFVDFGANKDNIIVLDSKGVIRNDREVLPDLKKPFATDLDYHQLEDAIEGADVFLGLSKADVLTPDMLKKMAKNPIVFALANPDPEIDYELAMSTRDDVIMATGRSDYPNQVNNVLGFPFIFRGALDVRATEINEEMKKAAVKAIADLAKKPVPDMVIRAYNQKTITFGATYLIPKPLDPRLLTTVAPAVAKAAMETGVAQESITDWEAYKNELVKRLGNDDNIIRRLTNKAKQSPQRIVFAEAEDYRILKAAQIVQDEGIAIPILLGKKDRIEAIANEHHIELGDAKVIEIRSEAVSAKREEYTKMFFEKRGRRGYNYYEAETAMMNRNYYGTMMVENGDADALLTGITRQYAPSIRPALEIIGSYKKGKKVSTMYLMLTKQGPFFFADTTITPNPTAEELADIAVLTARAVKNEFNLEPKVAMLSYSNFGSSNEPEPLRVRKAVEILKRDYPNLHVDGEVQANFALNPTALKESYPFSDLTEGKPNILIFPNLAAANIAYKLLQSMGSAEAIGPIVLGMNKPVHILQMGCTVREIVNMATIATVDAQTKSSQI